MIDERALSTMADIMGGIEQTDEWRDIQMNDPGVKAAHSRWDQALESAKAYLPQTLYNELSDANCGEVAAYCDVAILYGMRVAEIIRAVSTNPAEMTRYWLERAVIA